jgi:hypothetical protein
LILVEGGPDLLSAAWLSYAATADGPPWIPIGFLGSCCNFTPWQLAKASRRLVRMFVHDDDAGRAAAERWTDSLNSADCIVELLHVGRLAQAKPDGKPVEDLNDALQANDANRFAWEATQPFD